MKILSIVGARPQFIKAAVVSQAFLKLEGVEEHLLHTGQHYDAKMSDLFFEELNIPRPRYNLAVGSGRHGAQTGKMLTGIEEALLATPYDVMLVYGDTNSTLAGALAAAKLHIPVAHVEAGLRSFNRKMPEEVNRVLTDHVSDLLFCPTQDAVDNLQREGITEGVHRVGDVMLDCARTFAPLAEAHANPLAEYNLQPDGFVLMTCHRAENTDDPARMQQILAATQTIAAEIPVLFPVHPRTKQLLQDAGADKIIGLKLVEPVSYLEMLVLGRNAKVILTDSGGLQKEAFFLNTPCVTMRDETEWTETVNLGVNTLVGANAEKIVEAVSAQRNRQEALPDPGPVYGNGEASRQIALQTATLKN